MFRGMTEEEIEQASVDHYVEQVMRRVFGAKEALVFDEPLAIKNIKRGRQYKISNHVVYLLPSTSNDGCELSMKTVYRLVAYSDYLESNEIYSALIGSSDSISLNQPRIADFAKMDLGVDENCLITDRVVKFVLQKNPEILQSATTVAKLSFHTEELADHILLRYIERQLSHIVASHLGEKNALHYAGENSNISYKTWNKTQIQELISGYKNASSEIRQKLDDGSFIAAIIQQLERKIAVLEEEKKLKQEKHNSALQNNSQFSKSTNQQSIATLDSSFQMARK